MSFHAFLTLLGAVALICSQDVAALLLANRQSHPPLGGGGATRSLRRAISCWQGEGGRARYGC